MLSSVCDYQHRKIASRALLAVIVLAGAAWCGDASFEATTPAWSAVEVCAGPSRCFQEGRRYHAARMFTRSMARFVRGCELESGPSCRMVGLGLLDGHGVLNVRRGDHFLQRGCDLADGESCYQLWRLHMFYARPRGEELSTHLIERFYRLACRYGAERELQCPYPEQVEGDPDLGLDRGLFIEEPY